MDIVRISPEDATSLIDERHEPPPPEGRRKLAGTYLFHFGAFLDRNWRYNDMLWVTVDGLDHRAPGHRYPERVHVQERTCLNCPRWRPCGVPSTTRFGRSRSSAPGLRTSRR